MSNYQTIRSAHQIHSLFEAGRLGDLTDGQLLAKFLAVADNPELAETAFACWSSGTVPWFSASVIP